MRRQLLHHTEGRRVCRAQDRHAVGQGRHLSHSKITDPSNDKTYSGSGTVSGNSLKMKGCVLAVLCKSRTWTRL